MIKSRILLKNTTFNPIIFFCEKRAVIPNVEGRMEMIDLHLKVVPLKLFCSQTFFETWHN